MDDLSGKISELLSDPDTMEQLMSFAGMLGSNSDENEKTPNPPPVPAAKPSPQPKQKESSLGLPADTMQTVMRIMPILNSMNQEDDTTRLLNSLRPFLSKERNHRLDQATRLLQLLKILPVIKDLNI